MAATRPIRRILNAVLALLPLVLTLGVLWHVLAQTPFARPYVDRGAEATRAALGRAVGRVATPDWLAAELDAALAADDLDRARMLVAAAGTAGIAPDPETAARLAALEAAETGFWATAADCGTCIADIAACPSLRLMASCSLPAELSPVGDANALRRAGLAAWQDEDVDELEVALALTGLGATGAILVSGGASAPVKAGATALRLARRLGTLTPAFAADLARLGDVGLRPGRLPAYAARRVPLDEVVDTARLDRLAALAGEFGEVARNTSLAETVLLLRHVESADDAARLARLSAAAGAETRGTLEILGKARAFRALVRLSDLALGAAALIWLATGQLLLLAGERAAQLILRALRLRPLRPHAARHRDKSKGSQGVRQSEPPLTAPPPPPRPVPPPLRAVPTGRRA